MTSKALIVFTRNPKLGKCKTRLAKSIGDKEALDIYKYLLQHTASVAKQISGKRFVFYSENIQEGDIWHNAFFNKRLQKGNDLGERMENAFKALFSEGFKKVIIVGSDLLDLNHEIIEKAYLKLDKNDIVIGPAEDGGYYLLGMKNLHKNIFKNKNWGTESVRAETLNDLKNNSVYMLKELNDIDTFEDMQHYEELKPFYSK
ncbi:MAG: glycosyltransferase [Winogradskyella sp.]|uniref:TIGR04282 family arsenosugar biosynthesis glycosyltransferase n=1 Tax=Winogradskyella sp. TaxID=1883156 RepID=UPI0017915385|nr:TIGR04282 family arsenosugar biosynthesis glycosyltransferase [Winogradskyella sp.]MBT8245955.1 TIGR04282 family arsenosugar biosynthesis glycosyltransferase [Winogradskyella sp.]NNK21769.1 glycosyltransferase [Winogradskyella sp.]